MKALISTTEVFDLSWVTSWKQENEVWVPDTTETIVGCTRIVQIAPDNQIFNVHNTLLWVDCPDDCVADQWYYKGNQIKIKPQNVDIPSTPTPETSSNGEPGVIA
jgi:hypothetical protein